MSDEVLCLYPESGVHLPLQGLYLASGLRDGASTEPVVYTNFIASIDGRIALAQADGHHAIPGAIANRRDWRLFQELAALADVVITSGRYLREVTRKTAQDALPLSADAAYSDLRRFREDHGLAPQPAVAIVSASLDIDARSLPRDQRDVYIFTSAQADIGRRRALEAQGVAVIVAGSGTRVDGQELVAALAAMNYRLMYSIGGAQLCHALIAAGVLQHLFITQAQRLLGGEQFDTLTCGAPFAPPPDLQLRSLYFDSAALDGAGQTYAHYQLNTTTR